MVGFLRVLLLTQGLNRPTLTWQSLRSTILTVLMTQGSSVNMRSSDVIWSLILLGKKLLRLTETPFNLLLLLHCHIRKVLRVPLILLLHPLHLLLLLSHLLLLLRQVPRHFPFPIYTIIAFLQINLRILTLKILLRVILVLRLLRSARRSGCITTILVL